MITKLNQRLNNNKQKIIKSRKNNLKRNTHFNAFKKLFQNIIKNILNK